MPANGYSPAGFKDFSLETARLARQAAIMEQQELQLLARHGLAPGQHVVELGCGQGKLSKAVAEAGAASVTGIDVHGPFVSMAREAHRWPGLDFRERSVYELEGLPMADFVFARLLFQHLQQPAAALAQARKILRPGGRICIIDVNDEWLYLEPSVPAFHQLVREGIEQQRALGGDRLVGKRLPLYLRAAGFTGLQVEIIPFASAVVGMQAFLDIAVSFRANQVPGGDALYNTVLRALAADEAGYDGMAGIVCVSASAP